MNTQQIDKTTLYQSLWQMVVDDLIDKEAGSQVDAAWDLIRTLFKQGNRFERKQFSNLESVLGDTQNMKIVIDFIHYQMGRDEYANTWRKSLGDSTFGDRVVKHLEGLKDTTGRIVNAAKAKGLQPDNEQEEINRIAWVLARRYASYLEHAFLYHFKTPQPQKGGKL